MPSAREKLAKKKTKLAFPRKAVEDHPANLDYYEDGSFFNVEMDLINPDPDQPRKFFNPDSLAELSQSIKKRGVLQPVVIRKDHEGKIYLVAGERRYRAAKMASLKKIPCVLSKGDPVEIALIENLQREDLNPIEEAESLARLREKHNYTQEQLAMVVGKARTTITEMLSLNKLPKKIKKRAQTSNTYPRRLLFQVVKQKTPEKMTALFEQIQAEGLKSDQVKKIIQKKRGKKFKSGPDYPTIKKVSGLNKELGNLRVNQLDEAQQTMLLQKLEELKRTIDMVIAHI